MCIRCETREKTRRSLDFSRVSKPHTHITYMLRQCTSIVYIACNCVILSTNKGGQINFSVIRSVEALTSYFTKGASPSLNEVILTNKPNYYMNTRNVNYGLGDVYNMISIQIKGNEPINKKELKTYRSFKYFDQEHFISDLKDTDFDNVSEHDDVNKMYSKFEQACMKAVNKHAPLETKMPCPQPAPFINKELRKVVYK